MTAYSSSEAALMLNITPITLRKLSSAFSAWLSPAVIDTMVTDETWDRFYNDDDLDTLRYIIILLKQKRNYSWVRDRLTVEFGTGEMAGSNHEPEMAGPEQPAGERAAYVAAATIDPGQPASVEGPHMFEKEPLEPEAPQSYAKPDAAGAQTSEANDPHHGAPHVVEAEVVEPEPQMPPDIAAMLARIAELYQELLRNKEQEINALRQALDVTELSAANERRELEMLNRLAKMMERENQRLTSELEEAQRLLGHSPATRRGWLARVFGGGDEEASSAPQI
jgi:hypothetical protein